MVNIVSWMVDLKFSLAAETTENILTAVLLVQRQEHVSPPGDSIHNNNTSWAQLHNKV